LSHRSIARTRGAARGNRNIVRANAGGAWKPQAARRDSARHRCNALSVAAGRIVTRRDRPRRRAPALGRTPPAIAAATTGSLYRFRIIDITGSKMQPFLPPLRQYRPIAGLFSIGVARQAF